MALELAGRLHQKTLLGDIVVGFAGLKLRLNLPREAGLFDFGRRACGPWMLFGGRASSPSPPPARSWRPGIRLMRPRRCGRPTSTPVRRSIGESRGQRSRLAARIALAEGDLVQAEHAIASAREAAAAAPEGPRRGRLLKTIRLRAAAGSLYERTALDALHLTRDVPAGKLVLEIHLLLVGSSLEGGEIRDARAHAARAPRRCATAWRNRCRRGCEVPFWSARPAQAGAHRGPAGQSPGRTAHRRRSPPGPPVAASALIGSVGQEAPRWWLFEAQCRESHRRT